MVTKVSEQIQEQNNAALNKSIWGNVVLNVKVFGVKGDGVTDDYDALQQLPNIIKKTGATKVEFPDGQYRIGRGTGRTRDTGGITLIDISNVEISFAPNAVLLMDNLNPLTNLGDQCVGIMIKGNCENIKLTNVNVQWKTRPANRSTGDAIYMWGGVDPETCPRNILVLNPKVKYTPQAGIIMQGCKDITIQNALIEHTHADGIHLNANHNGMRVLGARGYDVGDDMVGIVTYYDINNPNNPYVYSNGRPPFNSPDLTTRNNNNTIVKDIVVDGDNHANGVRVSGAYDVTISNVKVRGRKTGIVVDSAWADGTTIGWSYLASRKIRIFDLSSYANNVGFHVQYFNRGAPDKNNWRNETQFCQFDVVAENITTDSENQYGIYLEHAMGVKMGGFNSANKEVRLRNVMNVNIDHLKISGGEAIRLIGKDDGWGYPLQNIPNHNVRLGKIEVYDTFFECNNIGGVDIEHLTVSNSPRNGIVTTDVADMTIGRLKIEYPNRGNYDDFQKNAIHAVRNFNTVIENLKVRTDTNNFAIDIGGASETNTNVTNGFAVLSGSIMSDRSDSSSGVTIQGGTYAARRVYLDVAFLNTGNPSAEWQPYSRPLIAAGSTSDRPTGGVAFVATGYQMFDYVQNRPIWHTTGENWVGGTGEILTSITATPLYRGQKAVIGSILYEAAGTSSPSDWKVISENLSLGIASAPVRIGQPAIYQGVFYIGVGTTSAADWMRVSTKIATSVSGTPEYIGQPAIVGGVAYMAVGTSGPTDWKQISN